MWNKRNPAFGIVLSIGLLILVCMPLQGQFSASSVSISPVEELEQILTDYVKITSSLSDRLNSSEKDLNLLQISTTQTKNSLLFLEQNYTKLNNILMVNESELAQVELTLKDSKEQIKSLEIGYKSMERELRISKIVGNVNIVITASLGVALLIVLASR